METKHIPLHNLHTSLGGKMVPFAGYMMPVRYSGDKEEHQCVRQGVGVFDVSHMGEFTVKGPHALALIQKVTSNDASKLVDGQAQYSCFPNETGGIVDDLIVYRLSAEDYLLVVNASNIQKDWEWINRHNTMGAVLENISDDICLFAVQGPKAEKVLQKITNYDLSSLSYYHFGIGEIGTVKDVIISATGYTGAGGFELYVHKEHAEKLWHEVFDAGDIDDIKPIGLGARDTLRLEMGYCLYGNDIDDSTSPLEAGLGWITKFSKSFINSERLQKQKESGLKKKLIAFEIIEKGIPRKDYEICTETGQVIGRVTSGTISPTLDKGIGLGYVEWGLHHEGSQIFIKIREKLCLAIVVKLPFIKK